MPLMNWDGEKNDKWILYKLTKTYKMQGLEISTLFWIMTKLIPFCTDWFFWSKILCSLSQKHSDNGKTNK